MTLVELLIVLGLMAAIATVALTTLDSMGDRTRMDTTRNRLDTIEQAIVGKTRHAHAHQDIVGITAAGRHQPRKFFGAGRSLFRVLGTTALPFHRPESP